MTFSPHTLLYILIGLGAACLILLIWNIRTEMRMHRLLRGKNATTLEDTIEALAQDIASLQKFEGGMKDYCTVLETRVKRSLQGVEMIRFNPFKGVGGGGNQSFAISLIDEDGNGLIISSLHHREGVSVFSKPVAKFVSLHELTEEEQQSLDAAKKKVAR